MSTAVLDRSPPNFLKGLDSKKLFCPPLFVGVWFLLCLVACSCVPFLCCVLSSVDVGPVDVTCDGQVLLSCDLLTGLVTDGVFFVSFLENLFVPWLRVVCGLFFEF